MSQRGRPGSVQAQSDAQRMPMAAAEALHWGKETYNQHTRLFKRMSELEEQHRVCDTRIQATEAIAEAAEAATSRIRRIEQQVAAIESDEQDRPFEKWVEEEITSFKGFVEKNKTVRQKQIELDKQVSNLEDSFDKIKKASRDSEILLHRIGRLENDRIDDANRIRRLENDLAALMSLRRAQIIETVMPQMKSTRKPTPRHTVLLPPRQHVLEAPDLDEETEDENFVTKPPTKHPEQAQIQVRRSVESSSE
jgi:predicted RNase H-like nuclease (RuvC/YqgF family)